jgi:glycosyltransferase involved in cell wall biosynthesis
VRVRVLTNQPEVADGTAVPTTKIELGPKLSERTAKKVAVNALPSAAKLARALRRERDRAGPIDVLLTHFKKEQLMAALLPRSLARSVVWAEWGPVPQQLLSGAGRRAYLWAARRAGAVIAVSESTRQSLEEAGVPPGKITVVPTVLDPSVLLYDPAARARYRSEWGAPDGELVVGVVSRLHGKKPLGVVIDALARLPADVKLVIAGDGPDEDGLRERAGPHGDRVRFIPTPRGYVQDVVSAFDLLVFAPQSTEGLPRAIVFGQPVERPVIVTDPRPVPGLVPDGTGSAVDPPNDAGALASLIEAYRVDPARRAREGAAGRSFALERYAPEVATDALERVLRSASA